MFESARATASDYCRRSVWIISPIAASNTCPPPQDVPGVPLRQQLAQPARARADTRLACTEVRERTSRSMSEGKTRYRVGIIGTGRIASTIQDESRDGPFRSCCRTRTRAPTGTPRNGDRGWGRPQRRAPGRFGHRWRSPSSMPTTARCWPRRSGYCQRLRADARPRRGHAGRGRQLGARRVHGEADLPHAAGSGRDDPATDAAGIKVVVNHVRTFDPYYRRIRWLIATGAIGRVRSIMAHWHEGMSFGGSHFFDLVRYFLESEPAWVFGRLESGTGSSIPVAAGSSASATASRSSSTTGGHAAPRELDIVGKAGRIRIGDTSPPSSTPKTRAAPSVSWSSAPSPAPSRGRARWPSRSLSWQAIETGARPASDLARRTRQPRNRRCLPPLRSGPARHRSPRAPTARSRRRRPLGTLMTSGSNSRPIAAHTEKEGPTARPGLNDSINLDDCRFDSQELETHVTSRSTTDWIAVPAHPHRRFLAGGAALAIPGIRA